MVAVNTTYSIPHTTFPPSYGQIPMGYSNMDIWIPIGLTIAIVLLVTLVIIYSKAKKRAQRRSGDNQQISSVSGMMGANVYAYRNYGNHASQQTLNSSTNNIQNVPASSNISLDLPSYDEVIQSDLSLNRLGNPTLGQDNNGFADLHQALSRIEDTPPAQPKNHTKSNSESSNNHRGDGQLKDLHQDLSKNTATINAGDENTPVVSSNETRTTDDVNISVQDNEDSYTLEDNSMQ